MPGSMFVFPSAKVWHGVSDWEPLPVVEGSDCWTGRMSFVFFTQQTVDHQLLMDADEKKKDAKEWYTEHQLKVDL
jgi:hypothetical protein